MEPITKADALKLISEVPDDAEFGIYKMVFGVPTSKPYSVHYKLSIEYPPYPWKKVDTKRSDLTIRLTDDKK